MSFSSSLNKIERAHQMYRDGFHEEALCYYTEALSMAKTNVQKIALHSNRAACFLKLHDFNKAAQECTLVLDLDHNHTGALMLRAQTLITLKEYNSALFDVNRLVNKFVIRCISEFAGPSKDTIGKSLAPILESEEELLVDELEDDEEMGMVEENEPTMEEKEIVVEEKEQIVEVEKDLKRKLEDGLLISAEENRSQQSVITPVVVVPQLKSVNEIQNFQQSMKVETIQKPQGHFRLDYSRWDSVKDDSSEDDEDSDEEESQPQYRFRLKTVGVRQVK